MQRISDADLTQAFNGYIKEGLSVKDLALDLLDARQLFLTVDDLDGMRKRVAEVEAVLKDVEWKGGRDADQCPSCQQTPKGPKNGAGHLCNCKLDLVITKSS